MSKLSAATIRISDEERSFIETRSAQLGDTFSGVVRLAIRSLIEQADVQASEQRTLAAVASMESRLLAAIEQVGESVAALEQDNDRELP